MKISYAKIAFKYVFGGKEAVLDYILDLANTAVASLSTDNKEKIKSVLEFANKLLALMDKLLVFCPAKWRGAWQSTTLALAAVVSAAEDFSITSEELTDCKTKFQVAYALWRTPDTVTETEALAAANESQAND